MQIVAVIAAIVVLALLVRAVTARGGRLNSAPSRPVSAPFTDVSVRDLLLHGRKIEAIKVYRSLHLVGLKDAKQAVERLAEQLPSSP